MRAEASHASSHVAIRFFMMMMYFVRRHEVYSANTHFLYNAGW